MGSNGYTEIKEQNYPPVSKMSDDEKQILISKNQIIYEHDARFWDPAIKLGKQCFDYVNGDIFTANEKADYRRKEKHIVTNAELIPKMNSLEAMQISGRRPGIVTAQGPEDSADAEAGTIILKSIQRDLDLNREMTECFSDGMISGFPVWMWFDKARGFRARLQGRRIDVWHPVWDSVLPDPGFKRKNYIDGSRIIITHLYDLDALVADYPEREQEIRAKIKMNMFDSPGFANNSVFNSSERDALFDKARLSSQAYDDTGLISVHERFHFIKMKAVIWVSPSSPQVEILPQEWTKEEIARWRGLNPDYQPIERNDVMVLWVTASTVNGILLDNARHWLQEGEFPGEVFIPKMLNNKPHGIVEYLRGPLKGKNIARIEWLHSLRLANDNLWKAKEGALKNPRDFPAEISKSGGVIIIDASHEMAEVEMVQNRREQMAWNDASEMFQNDLDRLFLDRNIEGGVQSSQESGKAIRLRIDQGQRKQERYLDSYNGFDLRVNKKILKILHYCYSEFHIFRFIDDGHQEKSAEVNVPEEYNWQTGAATRLRNNLAGTLFDYVETPGDDSVTGRESELKVFAEIMANMLPKVPQPDWPALLMSIPNRLANEFGRRMQERAESAEPEKPLPKLSFSFDGDDLLHNPFALQVIRETGYALPQQQPQEGQPEEGAEQQQQPAQVAQTG